MRLNGAEDPAAREVDDNDAVTRPRRPDDQVNSLTVRLDPGDDAFGGDIQFDVAERRYGRWGGSLGGRFDKLPTRIAAFLVKPVAKAEHAENDQQSHSDDDTLQDSLVHGIVPASTPLSANGGNQLTKATSYTVRVAEDKAGMRLDRFLAEAIDALSRNRIKNLVGDGGVSMDGGSAGDVAAKVRTGQVYIVTVPAARPAVPETQDIPLDIVYEDDDLIVINKPAGLVVHPAAGHADGTLVNALLFHCGGSLSGIGGITRPGIVHRLDKDTSGLMVATKNDRAHAHLSAQFAAHSLERAYLAVVWGRPPSAKGKISGNIGRSRFNRKKMAVVTKGGKSALTHYKILRPVGPAASLIDCRLATGRTHQIRVHMKSLGCPVVGDPLYGGGTQRRQKALSSKTRDALSQFNTQALHAYLIGFEHPITGEPMRFEVDKSLKMNELIELLDSI